MTKERPVLFSPFELGGMILPNRLVRSATAERLATHPEGRATPALAELYRTLAEGGVGLIITGHAYTEPSGRVHPEMLSAHSDEMLAGLQLLSDAVHEVDGRIALQINHGGRQCDPACVPQILAPSAVPTPRATHPKR